MTDQQRHERDDAEANYFAMHLLVPTDRLVMAVRQMGGIDVAGDGSDVRKLARKFGVSETVMAFRIGEEWARSLRAG